MSKHAPGPWGFDSCHAWKRFNIYREEAGILRHIATVNNLPPVALMGKSEEEAEANARLIAAAPEMLEALKEIVRQGEQIGGRNAAYQAGAVRKNAWTIAKQAIAKAEGR